MHPYTEKIQPIIQDFMIKVQKSHGYTQEMMAEKLKITPHSYNMLANGHFCASTVTFVMIMYQTDDVQVVDLNHMLHKCVDELEQDESLCL